MDLNFPLSVPFSPGPSYSFNSCCCCSPFWLLHLPNVLHNIPEAILNFFLWVPPSRLAHCTPDCLPLSTVYLYPWVDWPEDDLLYVIYIIPNTAWQPWQALILQLWVALTTSRCTCMIMDGSQNPFLGQHWHLQELCSPIVSGSPYTQKMLIFSMLSLHT